MERMRTYDGTVAARGEQAMYYEVEICQLLSGLKGELFCVSGGSRMSVGRVSNGLTMLFGCKSGLLSAAKRMALRHRDGPEIVRIDLDDEGTSRWT